MIDPHNRPVLTSGEMTLRAPVAGDVDARLALGAHAEILRMFGVLDPVQDYTRAMAQDWVDTQLQCQHAFIIEFQGQLIGALMLHSIDDHDRRASLAISLLDPAMLGQGLGSWAISVLMHHAFGAMGLNRVTVRVIDFNDRALSAYARVGFKQEGRERQAARVGETYHDDIIMGLLAREWVG